MRRYLGAYETLASMAVLLFAGLAWAQQPGPAVLGAAPGKPGSANLPLKRIVLFSSGVGFFEHRGELVDDAQVELRFRTENINDLLKSMVVMDEGGKVSVVTYASKDPISRTLKSFAVDLTPNPTLGELLNQLRGEKVRLEAPNEIVGTILGVEVREVQVGKDQVQKVEFLNLVTEGGIRSVALEKISAIKLVNEKIDSELNKALAVLASARDVDKKTVVIRFTGEGKRQGRIGYILETPVWKTSYRLVLEEGKPALLQGWAIVENTTEEDWNEVSLALVSGRPISFQMDLYQPLYLPRPWEKLELYASLRPRVYEQDLSQREKEFLARAEAMGGKVSPDVMAAEEVAAADSFKGGELQRRAFGRQGFAAAPGLAPPTPGIPGVLMEQAKVPKGDRGFTFPRDVPSAATAAQLGEAFEYEIQAPVNLPRQQSAMLPIVNAEIQAEKVSIYNPSVHAKHPLLGLRMTNTSKSYLMQGPITVFDEGAYAGDAKIQDVPPKSQRLLSYALDLKVEVAPESKDKPEEVVSVQLIKGVAYISRKYARSQLYTVKNSAEKVRKLLIEYPYDPQWTLVNPKEPAEKTRDMYRFLVEAKPGEPTTLTVEEERIERQQVAITNLDDGLIAIFLETKVVSDQVKTALKQVVALKAEWQALLRKRQQLEEQIRVIEQEQNRIRQNMAQLDRTSDLYKRYVQKFAEQEDQNDKLRSEIQAVTEQINAAKKKLDDYLMSLEVK